MISTGEMTSKTEAPSLEKLKLVEDEGLVEGGGLVSDGGVVAGEGIVPSLINLFTDDRGDIVLVPEVLSQLRRSGLRPEQDRRFSEFLRKVSAEPGQVGHSGHSDHSEIRKTMRVEEFQEASRGCADLLNSGLSCNLAIPDFKEFCEEIKSMYDELKRVKGGNNAQYIPQLARVDPNYWGISVCTEDGQRYSIGDVDRPFSIQSCSKALNYAICVTELGAEHVHNYLGKEPSGRAFNQIALDKNGLPHNPMINPGAIACCSVLRRHDNLADR